MEDVRAIHILLMIIIMDEKQMIINWIMNYSLDLVVVFVKQKKTTTKTNVDDSVCVSARAVSIFEAYRS